MVIEGCAGSPVYKILHLSDVHIDHLYAENTSTSCGEPLCCREYNGNNYYNFVLIVTVQYDNVMEYIYI